MNKNRLVKFAALGLFTVFFLLVLALPNSPVLPIVKHREPSISRIATEVVNPTPVITVNISPLQSQTSSTVFPSPYDNSNEIASNPNSIPKDTLTAKTERSKLPSSHPYYYEMMESGLFAYWDTTLEKRYEDYKQKHTDLTWVDVVTYVNIGIDKPFYYDVLAIIPPVPLRFDPMPVQPSKQCVMVQKFEITISVIILHNCPYGDLILSNK